MRLISFVLVCAHFMSHFKTHMHMFDVHASFSLAGPAVVRAALAKHQKRWKKMQLPELFCFCFGRGLVNNIPVELGSIFQVEPAK